MPPKHCRKGPTVDLLHMVERVLTSSHEPLSLGRIKALLPRKVMHSTPREAIEHYKRLGCATEGFEGDIWTLNADAGFWRVAKGSGETVSWPGSRSARSGLDLSPGRPKRPEGRNGWGNSDGGSNV